MSRVNIMAVVGILAFSLGACTPADTTIEGTAVAPNLTEDFTYYQDPRTGICFALMFNRFEGTAAVECTPEVMALIRGPVPATAPEAVR